MLRTSVPKASINENGYFPFGECDIRIPHDFKFSTPSFYSVIFQQRNKLKFSGFVPSRTNAGHYLRSSFDGDRIHRFT